MTIGIVSDTHGYFHPALPSAFAGVDRIYHAGDIGSPEVLDMFRGIAPTEAVFGNVDAADIRQQCPEVLDSRVGEFRILMMHIAGRPGRFRSEAIAEIKRASPDMFVCGHSHILQIERVPEFNRLLFVNPGAAGRQGVHRVKTCVRIKITDGKADEAEVIHLDEFEE
jgi:putative phosphoesterase